MGKRSRKRATADVSRRVERREDAEPVAVRERVERREPSAAPRPRPRTRSGAGKPERPPAPWGKFPLVELCVLLALVLGVIGFFTVDGRGPILLACAAALGSLAGLELSIREHFAGFKSHTMILAGTIAVGSLAAMYLAGVGQGIMLAVGAAVFATAIYAFREVFKRRAGVGFR
jgi:hypothetical protein